MATLVKAVIEKCNYGYSVYVADDCLNYGLLGEGKTVQEAIEDFKLSYIEMKESYTKEQRHFVEADFEFYFDVASFLQMYAFAFTLAGLERITGVNQRQLSHYINGVKKPSQRTINKIEAGLKKFSNELSAVRFA